MHFTQHLRALFRRNRLAFILSGSLSVLLFVLAITEGTTWKTTVYLLVMAGSFIVSEFMFHSGNLRFGAWPIKHPQRELYIIVATQVIVAGLLVFWFLIVDQGSADRAVRLTAMLLRILFVFPVFFLIYFLGVRKYNLRQLGIWRPKHWYVALPVILVIGGTTYLTNPESMQFRTALAEGGYLSFLTLGFLTAAIPEEITRTLLQSRLGRVWGNKSLAWFMASLIWALLHIPLFHFRSGDAYNALLSALGILPIGLLWGYLNERYRSIIPSTLIHGTNLWGLHNIF